MAVTVNIFARGGGTIFTGPANTALSAAQAAGVQKQAATIVMGDTDTQALFTHNWGLDASAPTYLEPNIQWYAIGPLPGPTGTTWMPALTFDISNTNVVKVNKFSANGTACTFAVILHKPQSTGQ